MVQKRAREVLINIGSFFNQEFLKRPGCCRPFNTNFSLFGNYAASFAPAQVAFEASHLFTVTFFKHHKTVFAVARRMPLNQLRGHDQNADRVGYYGP